MNCIRCAASETRVIDSRWMPPNQVRRRRECPECCHRFTTYEQVSLSYPKVIKRDGSLVPFDTDKIRKGVLSALKKRPDAHEFCEMLIAKLVLGIMQEGVKEISTARIGDAVMQALLELDLVAYVRFASVYKSFESLQAFHLFIDQLQNQVEDPS